MSKTTTEALRGFAILAIIFSHIGYSLGYSFLYPLSILGGVAVNLFLFLSGFGVAASSLSKNLPPLDFYKKRLKKLFLPMWVVLTIYLLLDYVVLQRTYSTASIVQNFCGFFPRADLFTNVNSPLWYFSLIFYYYLIFPLFLLKKIRPLSPVLMLIFTYLLLQQNLPVHRDVINLYKLHFISFPLGVFLALFLNRWPITAINIKNIVKAPLLAVLIFVFLYTAVNSHVAADPKIEQSVSIITMLSLVSTFLLLNWQAKIFNLFGKYSYEIYLLHWPILSRYDLFYQNFPASLATLLYLALFIALAWLLNKIIKIVCA